MSSLQEFREKVLRGVGEEALTSDVVRAVEKAGKWLENQGGSCLPLAELLSEFLTNHIIRLARIAAGEKTSGQSEREKRVMELFGLCVARGANMEELKEMTRVVRDSICDPKALELKLSSSRAGSRSRGRGRKETKKLYHHHLKKGSQTP